MIKRFCYSIIVASVLLMATSCGESFEVKDNEKVEPVPVVLTKSQQGVLKAENAFGIELLKTMYVEGNVAISPFSTYATLSLLANGASGPTREEITKVIGLEGFSIDDVNGYYKSMSGQLKLADEKAEISIANSVWMNKELEFAKTFKDVASGVYGSYNQSVSFDSAGEAQINKWVEDNTGGKVKGIASNVPEDTDFIIADALHFSAAWLREPSVEKLAFNRETGSSIETDFIVWSDGAKVYYDENVEVCEIPYASGAYSFVAMMPVSAGLGSFLEELDSDKFENLVSRVNPSGTSVSFVVKIPKFAISFDSGDDVLKDALISMGMETAFSPAADYSGIYKDGNAPADEHRYEILQKCTVNVDEKGTDAAAATVFEAIRLSANLQNFHYVILDHPFLFAIRENSSGALIFLGTKGL